MLRITIVLLLLVSVDTTLLHEKRRLLIERMRLYLRQSEAATQYRGNSNWLPNSNTIGIGYNLLSASPICYTGACQMNEFTHSVFKLNYSSSHPGACTDKLVPNSVSLFCLPSVSQSTVSEIIETAEHLSHSISNKVETSIGAKILGISFSYKYSKQTQRMLDSIVKNHTSSIRTSVEVSYAKLSMFEPRMELSDDFRYVIEEMPCCEEDDSDIEDYVKEHILDRFGVAYVSELYLGGIAQQTMFIRREEKERLERNGVQIQREAAVAFDKSMSSNVSNQIGVNSGVGSSESNANYNQFINVVVSSYANMLGGDLNLGNFVEWTKSIRNNPAVIRSKLKETFRLISKRNFPMDSLIANKSGLIEYIFQKYYINGTIYCYGNCGNGANGICKPTGLFNFGICQCNSGWTGADCMTPAETNKILHGTICGFDRSFMRIPCYGLLPWNKCPDGWLQHNWKTDLTVCYKSQTVISRPVHGTLCGIHSSHSRYNFDITIGCQNTYNLVSGMCPENYTKKASRKSGAQGSVEINTLCASTNANKDLPGTLCGMQIEDSIDGPSCDGFHPGLRQCPANYEPRRTAFSDYGFMVCVKK